MIGFTLAVSASPAQVPISLFKLDRLFPFWVNSTTLEFVNGVWFDIKLIIPRPHVHMCNFYLERSLFSRIGF